MFSKNCFQFAIAFLFAAAALTADDRGPITERALASAQYQAIEEARATAKQSAALKYGNVEYSSYGADHNSSHKGSYHIYSGVTAYADQVELEDGSMWFVLPAGRQKILDWRVGDTIAILKGNHTTNYRYNLYNEATNQTVEVELSAAPYEDNFYHLKIKDINIKKHYLLLSDGSKWTLPTSWFEQEIWKKWYIGDSIIIGSNDQFFGSMTRPDILINITCSATYTPSKCVN